jgi:hypothetical protein
MALIFRLSQAAGNNKDLFIAIILKNDKQCLSKTIIALPPVAINYFGNEISSLEVSLRWQSKKLQIQGV